MTPSFYLKEAQRRGKKFGYKGLEFSDDTTHKLQIRDPKGRLRRFGRVGYGDFLIWSHIEKAQKAPKGTADAKRRTFQVSHQKIRGDWKSDDYSPNNLALRVLW